MSQTGTVVEVRGPLTGQCGAVSSPVSFSIGLASSSSTSASFTLLGQSFTARLSGLTITLTNDDFPSCSGSAVRVTSGASSVCFHESTVITYKGAQYTSEQLEKHPECRIPHHVQARGTIIETSCGTNGASGTAGSKAALLRLTDDHLVFTPTGLRAALDLKAGDAIFSDASSASTCQVLRVSKEMTEQPYFGLNCLHSEVLANAVKCSTFGKYHFVPSTWMSWTGRLIGVERASRWGDALVELLVKARII